MAVSRDLSASVPWLRDIALPLASREHVHEPSEPHHKSSIEHRSAAARVGSSSAFLPALFGSEQAPPFLRQESFLRPCLGHVAGTSLRRLEGARHDHKQHRTSRRRTLFDWLEVVGCAPGSGIGPTHSSPGGRPIVVRCINRTGTHKYGALSPANKPRRVGQLVSSARSQPLRPPRNGTWQRQLRCLQPGSVVIIAGHMQQGQSHSGIELALSHRSRARSEEHQIG